MNEGAANLVDHVFPEGIPIRQWVLTLPYPLRYPLAFDAKLLGKVLHIFTNRVSVWYRRHNIGGKTDSVTVIQRASSDLRLNPHFHTLFLDGVYATNQTGAVSDDEASDDEASDDEASDDETGRETPIFMVESIPTQEDVESVVHQSSPMKHRYVNESCDIWKNAE